MAAGDGADVTELPAQARADRVAAGQVEPDGAVLRDGTLAGTGAPEPFLYGYTGMHGSFEDFKARLSSQSPERLLEYALIELWRCGRLHSDRYRRLHHAVRWLLASVAFLFIAIALSAG